MGKNKERIKSRNSKARQEAKRIKKGFAPAPNAKEREAAAQPPVETILDFDPLSFKVMFPQRVPYAH